MARTEKSIADENFRQIASDMMQLVIKLRNDEKMAKQQQDKIDSLEKMRDSQTKTIAENESTVSTCS